MANSFYPDDYEPNESVSDYMKLTEGDHRIRILSKPIIGFETGTGSGKDFKPHRAKTFKEAVNMPSDDGKVTEFHAFLVWDYETNMIRLLNVKSKKIQAWLYNQTLDEDWADPTKYDIVIKRTGKGFNDTEYSCTAKLPKPIDPSITAAREAIQFEPEKYFEGGHPIIREQTDGARATRPTSAPTRSESEDIGDVEDLGDEFDVFDSAQIADEVDEEIPGTKVHGKPPF